MVGPYIRSGQRLYETHLPIGVHGSGHVTMNRPLADDMATVESNTASTRTEAESWQWSYYPKVEHGPKGSGTIRGTREEAIAACKAAIDQWLGPANSN